MYVLRNTRPGPDYFEEAFYDEVVSVRNGIALVVREHVRDALLSPLMGYELIGTIEDSNELSKLLSEDKKKDELAKIGLSVKIHAISIEDMYQPEESQQPEQKKSWVDNLQ